HVRARRERAKPVHVDLDAAFDDARHEAEHFTLLLERPGDDELRALRATRMPREDDEPTAAAVGVHDADALLPELEDARRPDRLLRLGPFCARRAFGARAFRRRSAFRKGSAFCRR